MQNVSNLLRMTLENEVQVRALPRLIAEWNQNRYAGIETVDAWPSEAGEDQAKDSFPISSIVEANRPTKGVIKGRTSSRAKGGNEGFAAPRYSDNPEDVRYYTTGADSIYKYWSSAEPSNDSRELTTSVFVVYEKLAWANKIVIGLENTWSSPAAFTVQITTNGTTWTTVATNPTINSDGQIVLYRQGSSWGPTVSRNNPVQIKGVQLNVSYMDKPDSFLNVIEVSSRLERDLSEFVIDYNSRFTMAESSFITPLGTASSNEASVTLSNIDGVFNYDNPDSLYYDLMEKNVRMVMDLVYDLPGGGTEAVREFTMFVEDWSGPGESEITASLKDFSKYMQEQNCPEQLLENVTVGEAVWRLCDSIGFVDYNYERDDEDPAGNLQFFYTSKEDVVWDIFQQLAEGTQTAIYFDEYGILQIQTRDSAFSRHSPPVWTFRYDQDPVTGRLPDIVELTNDNEFEANKVNIKYQNTKVSEFVNGWPVMEVVWEPDSSFLLRSSNLMSNLPATMTEDNDGNFIQITPSDGKHWPYDGMLTVGGELIRYKGKHYNYYKKGGGQQGLFVYSQAEKDNIDRNLSDPNQAYKNDFTGGLKIEERGVYWTKPLDHKVGHAPFQSDHFWWNNNGSNYSWGLNGGVTYNPTDSILTLRSNSDFEGNRILRAMTGEPGYAKAYNNYGVRMRIPSKNGPTGGGGLFFFGGDSGAGYYVELLKTEIFDVPGGPQREIHGNEVGFFSRRADGTFLRPVDTVPMQITADKWYDIDVEWTQGGPAASGDFIHKIRVYINGQLTFDLNLETGRASRSGKFGIWLRGNNAIEYEYLYAHDKEIGTGQDDMTRYDRIKGGYASSSFEHDFVFGKNMQDFLLYGKETSPNYEANTRFFFDEFGPIVHEVREMEVPFTKGPVLHSNFYTSNDTQIVLPYYNGSAYRAKFMIANASRDNAVAQGEDLLLFGKDSPAEQKTFIYGRLVYQEDEQTHVAENKNSIRRRGKIETEFSSKWIQSKAEAEKLGDWILANWSLGSDEITIQSFGNPLLQLGDLVFVNYPDLNMDEESHRYFITGITNDFNKGLGSTFTLRRSKV